MARAYTQRGSTEDERRIFASNLKYWLKVRGMSQADLGDKLSLPRTTVNNWCKEISMPSLSRIELIATILNVGKSDLLFDRENTAAASSDRDILVDRQLMEYTKKLRTFSNSDKLLIYGMIDTIFAKNSGN